MKPSESAKVLIKAIEKLECEKITKIHEIWVLEAKIQKLQEKVEATGCKLINIINQQLNQEL